MAPIGILLAVSLGAGLSALVAYPASGPIGSLLHRLSGQSIRPVQSAAAELTKRAVLAETHI